MVGPSLKRFGVTTVDAEDFFRFFEASLRRSLATTEIVRFRPANNFLDVSFSGINDFIIAVMGVAGANIRSEIFSTFKGKIEKQKPINSCVLRLDLLRNCLDVRLVFFLYEVLGMKSADGTLTRDVYERENTNIKKYEDWLSKY